MSNLPDALRVVAHHLSIQPHSTGVERAFELLAAEIERDEDPVSCGHQIQDGGLRCAREPHEGSGHVYIGNSADDRHTRDQEGVSQ